MNEITKKAWQVFRSAFKDGEQVVVEDCHGNFEWGKMVATKDSIILTRPGGRSRTLDWKDIEFICHDGFPVQDIMDMTPEEAGRRAKETPTKMIRRLLSVGSAWFGGGCPFVAGPCKLITIHNCGNCGPAFYERDDAEVLVFQAKDGAIMHSYDTEHLFLNI